MTMRNQPFESMYLLLKDGDVPLPGSFSGGKDVNFPWSVFFSRDEIPNTFAEKITNRLPSKVIPRCRMNCSKPLKHPKSQTNPARATKNHSKI